MSSNPGSPEAVKRGCMCTSENNQGGKGWYGEGERFGWDISLECTIHGLGEWVEPKAVRASGDSP